MSDTSTTNGAATPAREGKCTMKYDVAAATISAFLPKNKGGALIATYDTSAYSAEIRAIATMHGLQEKLRDSFSEKGADPKACMDEMHAQLLAGTWDKGGGDREATTDFMKAWHTIMSRQRKAAGKGEVDFDTQFLPWVRAQIEAKEPIVAQMRQRSDVQLEVSNIRKAREDEKQKALRAAVRANGAAADVVADPFG